MEQAVAETVGLGGTGLPTLSVFVPTKGEMTRLTDMQLQDFAASSSCEDYAGIGEEAFRQVLPCAGVYYKQKSDTQRRDTKATTPMRMRVT